jgi:hypothetical protein
VSGESDRSKRVETSVHVYRLRLAPLPQGAVVFAWDYPGSTLLRVRILRAPAEPDRGGEPDAASGASTEPDAAPEAPVAAPDPEPDSGTTWQIIYDGDTGSFRDRGLPAANAWRYAVFARDGDGPWTLWRDEIVTMP